MGLPEVFCICRTMEYIEKTPVNLTGSGVLSTLKLGQPLVGGCSFYIPNIAYILFGININLSIMHCIKYTDFSSKRNSLNRGAIRLLLRGV